MEFTDRHPIVNLRLFAHRNFAAGTRAGAGLCRVLRHQPAAPAMATDPDGLHRHLGAGRRANRHPPGVPPPLVGRYANHFDLRMLAGLSFLAMAITCFMRANFTTEVDYQHIAIVQLIMGARRVLFAPILSILLSDPPPTRSPTAPAWPPSCAPSAAASPPR